MYFIRGHHKTFFIAFDFLALTLTYILFFDIIEKVKVSSYHFFLLVFIFSVIAIFTSEYENIIERGYLVELQSTFIFAFRIMLTFIVALTLFNNEVYLKYKFNYQSALLILVICFLFLYTLRIIVKLIYRKIGPQQSNIIILSELDAIAKFESTIPDNYQIQGYYVKNANVDTYHNKPVLKNNVDIRDFLADNKIDEIYSNALNKNISDVLFQFRKVGIPIKLCVDSIVKDISNESLIVTERDRAYIVLAAKTIKLRDYLVKRAMDILLSLFGIAIMAIIGLFIFPIIAYQSPGPLFFKQLRVGKNGKQFKMYKFRSMYCDAESRLAEVMSQNQYDDDLMFKTDNDPRIFPFGKIMREWSLDEFPQFINVLKGDMSVVGTRPPTVYEYQKYQLHHFKRLLIKPGITGMWQINGRSDIKNFEDVVKLDVEYIENWSLRLDIKILLKTILVVLKRCGSK